ncbi:MAG: hypothetical protein Kow00108_05030 [Calditrichia bacterium]
MNVYYVQEEGNQSVAFFVKKKIGNAVKRNRSKRLVREFYRTHQHYFQNMHIIFLIKRFIPDLDCVKEDLNYFIKHEKIIYMGN